MTRAVFAILCHEPTASVIGFLIGLFIIWTLCAGLPGCMEVSP